jgi:hypothetical protein
VPDDFVDDVALVGPAARVRDRLQMWRDSPITTLNVIAYDIATLRQLAEWVL